MVAYSVVSLPIGMNLKKSTTRRWAEGSAPTLGN